MPKDQRKYLFDILDSINLIQSYLEGIEDWEELIGNHEKADAIQRRMAIIGEALHRLKKFDTVFEQSDWAINLRNTLVHQYDKVGIDTLWYRAKNDLPGLKEAVVNILP